MNEREVIRPDIPDLEDRAIKRNEGGEPSEISIWKKIKNFL